MAHSAVFDFEGVSVNVSVPERAQLEWLLEFLAPSFDVDDLAPSGSDIEVVMDSAGYERCLAGGPDGGTVEAFVFDSKAIHLPSWKSVSGRRTIFDEAFRVFYEVDSESSSFRILTTDDNHLLVRTPVMRVVRELAMTSLRGSKGLFLHSSSFAADGRGVVVAGPTKAGKSTTLIYMLQHGRHKFISNDRVYLRSTPSGVIARGMPTVVTIRQSTLDVLPNVSEVLLGEGYNFRLNRDESAARGKLPQMPRPGGEFGLNPLQYCQWLDVEPVREAPLSLLLCPEQTGRPGGVELVRLDSSDAVELLKGALFGLGDWTSVSEVFVPPGTGQVPSEDELAGLCHGLLDHTPCYLCKLGLDSLKGEDFSREVDELILRLASDRG